MVSVVFVFVFRNRTTPQIPLPSTKLHGVATLFSLPTHHDTCTLQEDHGNQNQSASSRQDGVGGESSSGRWISGLTSLEVVRTITHALQRKWDQFTAPVISSIQQLSTGVRSFFTPTQENTLVEFDDALSALRDLLNNDAVQFKSYSQFPAIQQLLANKQDLLLNLGTGQGKISLVLAAAKAEQGKTLRCCTVYISPLKALAHQTYQKALESGFDARSWTSTRRTQQTLCLRAPLTPPPLCLSLRFFVLSLFFFVHQRDGVIVAEKRQ